MGGSNGGEGTRGEKTATGERREEEAFNCLLYSSSWSRSLSDKRGQKLTLSGPPEIRTGAHRARGGEALVAPHRGRGGAARSAARIAELAPVNPGRPWGADLGHLLSCGRAVITNAP